MRSSCFWPKAQAGVIVQRITLKVGSSVLTENNAIAKERMLNLVSLISALKQRYEVVLVSSGAVRASAH